MKKVFLFLIIIFISNILNANQIYIQSENINNGSIFVSFKFTSLKNYKEKNNSIFSISSGLETDIFNNPISFFDDNPGGTNTIPKIKPENIFLRAEIVFFGSLTLVLFMGWLSISLFNYFIYNDTFGTLRREQFLVLYASGAIISFSVSLSDLFINLKLKTKKVEIF